jgi:hypothetical protein
MNAHVVPVLFNLSDNDPYNFLAVSDDPGPDRVRD